MYQIPLRYIKISKEVLICATRIVAVMSTSIYQARRAIKEEKSKGTLINGAGTKKALCAIFLDNGAVVSSPFRVERIMNAIERANLKSVKLSNEAARRLKVYQLDDERPKDELDFDFSDMAVDDGQDDIDLFYNDEEDQDDEEDYNEEYGDE